VLSKRRWSKLPPFNSSSMPDLRGLSLWPCWRDPATCHHCSFRSRHAHQTAAQPRLCFPRSNYNTPYMEDKCQGITMGRERKALAVQKQALLLQQPPFCTGLRPLSTHQRVLRPLPSALPAHVIPSAHQLSLTPCTAQILSSAPISSPSHPAQRMSCPLCPSALPQHAAQHKSCPQHPSALPQHAAQRMYCPQHPSALPDTLHSACPVPSTHQLSLTPCAAQILSPAPISSPSHPAQHKSCPQHPSALPHTLHSACPVPSTHQLSLTPCTAHVLSSAPISSPSHPAQRMSCPQHPSALP